MQLQTYLVGISIQVSFSHDVLNGMLLPAKYLADLLSRCLQR